MNDEFAQRVRSGAAAAWWTVLIAAIFVTLQWAAYLVIVSTKPTWYLALWGPDTTWSTVQTVSINAIALVKVGLWLMALLAVWLTLWSGRLKSR